MEISDRLSTVVALVNRPVDSARMCAPMMRFDGALYADADDKSPGSVLLQAPADATLRDVNLAKASIVLHGESGVLMLSRVTDCTWSSARALIFDPAGAFGARLLRFDLAEASAERAHLGMVAILSSRDGVGLRVVGGQYLGHSRGHVARGRRGPARVRGFIPIAERCVETAVPVLLGADFARELLWSVTFRPVDGIGIGFLTDPTGVREALALRELEPGARRRAALIHWVQAHQRKNRGSDADLSWVRKHLRGRNNCVIGGLPVEIGAPMDEVRAELRAAQ